MKFSRDLKTCIYMQNGLSIIQTFNYINAPFGRDRNTA